ncbi:exported protein of unknown function [Paraburkholderia kururiensis]
MRIGTTNAQVKPAMKKSFLLAPSLLLAACGSPSGPQQNAAVANGPTPMIYVSSMHAPASISRCLENRLGRVHESRANGATELEVGSRSNASYFVTLTPSANGSVVRVVHPDNAPNDPPEEEMRFHVARCAV